jgi:hypothetical protein
VLLDALGQALDVERVARHGLAQLVGGAGELGQDERPAAAAGLLDGDVLLGDEVHPVDERRDEQRGGECVVGGELLLRQSPYR